MSADARYIQSPNSRQLRRLLRSLSVYSSLIVFVTGGIVLLGWAADIDLLKSILPGQVTMKPNTTIGFMVSGILLGLWHYRSTLDNLEFQKKLTYFIDIGSAFVLLLGLLTLIEYYFQINFRIDQLLFAYEPDAVDAIVQGKMAPNTAVNFILCGLAFLLLSHNYWYLAQLCSLFGFLIALVALTGYLYAVAFFCSLGSPTAMAIHAAICFIFLSLGTLLTDIEQGWMCRLSRDNAGGIMARRLIPILSILPLILGVLIFILYETLKLTPESAFALRSLLEIVILVSVVWCSIKTLNKAENKLLQLNQKLQDVNTLLQRREEQFRVLAENIPDTITRHDREYRYLYANPAWTQQSGIPSKIYQGKTPRELGYPQDIVQKWETSLETVFLTHQITVDEFEVVKNNEVRNYQTLVVPEFASDSSVQSVLTISRDITQLRQAEHQLRKLNLTLENQVQNRTAELAATNALLRQEVRQRQAFQRELFQQKRLLESFFQGSPVGMVMLNEKLEYIHLNEAIASINGVLAAACLGRTVDEILPDLASQLKPIYQQVLQTGESILNIEISGETPKHPGVTRYWQASYFPLLREDHNIMGLGGVIVEISDRKRAEIALQQSEEQFRKAVIEAPFPIIIHGEDGEILQISNTVTEITGYTTDEISTIEDWTEQAYGERQGVVLEGINQLYQLNHRVDEGEFEVKTKDGSTRIWNFSSAPLGQLWDHKRLVISIATDTTERKQAEVALATRLRQQAVITQLDQMALSGCPLTELFDRTTELVAESVGVEYCKVLELLPDGEAFVLRSGVGWQVGLVGEATVEANDNSQAGYILQVREPVIVEDLTTESRFNRSPLLIEHHVVSGMSILIEGRHQDQPFGTLSVHSTQKQHFSPDDVNFLQAIAYLLAEAIARKESEEEIYQLNQTLEQRVQERTQQLEEAHQEMEAFSYSVAHDLRAPLRAIQGFSQVLIEDYSPRLDQLGQEYINRMGASAEHLDQLIQDLLAYSRLGRTEVQLRRVSLSAVIEGVLNELKPELEAKQAQVFVNSSLPVVKAQRNVLKQVIFNLVANANKFVKPSVLPIILVKADPPQVNPLDPESSWVRLWIEDNGIGILPQHQERIFEAFERLHGVEAYPGTGIGLAIVKRGIERMGGRVGVESVLGEGSRFWIELKGELK